MRERGNINNPAALQGHLTIIGEVGNRPLWMGGLGLRSSKCPLMDVDTHTTDRHQSVHRLGSFISHKTKRCSLFSHFLPQPVRDPHLLHKHGRDSQGRNHPARDSSARPLCNFYTWARKGGYKTWELTAKMCGLAAKKYGSQLAGHQKNAHVHTHARTHIHTTPFFAPFGRSCVSPVTEDNKGGPGTAGLQQAREGKKEWKGVSKYNQKRDLVRGDQGGGEDRVMDPSWGGEKVGEKDGTDSHNWRKWRTQVGSSCNQTACDLLKESNYIQTLSACPPGRTAGPLTRWSRAWETSGHHKETRDEKREEKGRGEEEEEDWEEGEGASEKRQQRPVGHHGDDFLCSWVCFLRHRQVREWRLQALNVQPLLQR